MTRYDCQGCRQTVKRGDAVLRTILGGSFLQLVAWHPDCFHERG